MDEVSKTRLGTFSVKNIWDRLTEPQSTHEDEARREYMTKVILSLAAIAAGIFTLPVLVGWSLQAYPFPFVLIMLIFDLALMGGLWLSHHGGWESAVIFPRSPSCCSAFLGLIMPAW